MSRLTTWSCGLVAATGGLFLPPVLSAQTPRARTLTYHPDRQSWVEQVAPLPGTPEGDLRVIRSRVLRGEHAEALTAVKQFAAVHGESPSHTPDLLLAQAEALIGRREYVAAYAVLQEFLAKYAGAEQTGEALRLEFVIAETFLSGAKRKILGLRLFSGEDLALRILDEIAGDHPTSRLAELAIKTAADHYFAQGDHTAAELAYARLVREFPRTRYLPYAARRSAEATLAGFGGVHYDEAKLIEAAERYRDYRARHPSEAQDDGVDLILDGIRESRAEKELSIGAYYERTEHLGSAVYHYRAVLADWPDTVAAARATVRLEMLGTLESVPAGVGATADAVRSGGALDR